MSSAASAACGRTSWSGLLRLSLVAVPVKAYSAVSSDTATHFNQLHANCGQRIRYEKRCPSHGPVDAAAIVRGYPSAPDQYVVVEPEELEKLRPAQDKALVLEQFVGIGQIEPTFFAGRSLYLLPDGSAAQHPYGVVTAALQASRKAGLGRVVLSGHRQLVLVRPAGRLLVLDLLHCSSAGLRMPQPGRANSAAVRPRPKSCSWPGSSSPPPATLSIGRVTATRPPRNWRPWSSQGSRQPTASRACGRTGRHAATARRAQAECGRRPGPTRSGVGDAAASPPAAEGPRMNPPLRPMLATSARPFDSDEHLFEIKWDGVRALAAVDGDQWRLWGRQGADYGDRYPELAVLRRLPSGTIVDGELVVLADGRADLNAVLRRHQLRSPDKVRHAGGRTPVHYLLFDLLRHHGRSLLEEPLARRRAVLAEMTAQVREPRLVFSAGIVGPGRELFERAVAAGHEGVMAKHVTSRYRPGQRSPAWRKVKPAAMIPCLIVGYTAGRDGLRSVLVAAVQEGSLRYVAELTCGFAAHQKADLAERLAARQRSEPVVACPKAALWVEPGLYCRVQFLRWTPAGRLRDAVFRGLLDDGV